MLIATELVEVKPLGSPQGILYYMDFNEPDILAKRRKKIDKIKERICGHPSTKIYS